MMNPNEDLKTHIHEISRMLQPLLDHPNIAINLMRTITKNPNEPFSGIKKYNVSQIEQFEKECERFNVLEISTLLEEWSTTGNKLNRPKIHNLMTFLLMCFYFDAAACLARATTNIWDYIDRRLVIRPVVGPGASIDISIPHHMHPSVKFSSNAENRDQFKPSLVDKSIPMNTDSTFKELEIIQRLHDDNNSNASNRTISDLIKFSTDLMNQISIEGSISDNNQTDISDDTSESRHILLDSESNIPSSIRQINSNSNNNLSSELPKLDDLL